MVLEVCNYQFSSMQFRIMMESLLDSLLDFSDSCLPYMENTIFYWNIIEKLDSRILLIPTVLIPIAINMSCESSLWSKTPTYLRKMA